MTHPLLKRIQELLMEQEYVIIPGFGGLISKKSDSEIIENTINPRGNKLAFNKNLTANDGILINYIAELDKISTTEAQNLIQSFVRGLEEQLKTNSEIALDKIGKFQLNEENKLVFTPFSGFFNSLDSYGLQPIEIEIPKSNSKSKKHKNPLSRKGKSKKQWLSLLLIYSLIGAFGYGSYVMWNKIPFKKQLSFSEINPFKDSIKALEVEPNKGTEQNLNENLPETKPEPTENQQKTEDVTEKKLTPSDIKKSSDSVYYIIGGAFSLESNAEKFAKEIQQKNTEFNPSIIKSNGSKLARVAYLSLNDRSIAEEKLEQIKKSENSQAWIFAEKK